MDFLFILGLLALMVWMIVKAVKNAKGRKGLSKSLKAQGFDTANKVVVGKYLGGHPNIDKAVNFMEIIPNATQLHIYGTNWNGGVPKEMASIDKEKIQDIAVVDASTMQSRLSVGALALVGVFAFAMPKKKKMEMAYVSIKWNDGRFNHETIFEYEGTGSMQKANTARNKLIKVVR